MKRAEVVYSPVCEASAAFLGALREWLDNTGVEIVPLESAWRATAS